VTGYTIHPLITHIVTAKSSPEAATPPLFPSPSQPLHSPDPTQSHNRASFFRTTFQFQSTFVCIHGKAWELVPRGWWGAMKTISFPFPFSLSWLSAFTIFGVICLPASTNRAIFGTTFMTRRPPAPRSKTPFYYITACPVHYPSISSLASVHQTIISL
jgi:hypothetical protein